MLYFVLCYVILYSKTYRHKFYSQLPEISVTKRMEHVPNISMRLFFFLW